MKNRLITGMMLTAIVTVAHAQDERADVRKQAEKFFASMDEAINKHDYTQFWAMFAPGYYNVDMQGHRLTFTAFKAGIVEMQKGVKDIKSATLVKNVQLQGGGEAVVWTEQKLTFRSLTNGKWQPFVMTTRWAESLKSVDDKWVVTSSQQLQLNEPWSFKTTK